MTALLDQALLQNQFPAWQIQVVPEIDSTNQALLRNPDQPTPLLLAAESQTAGRGRGSNSWISHAGSLTFSLMLSPDELNLPRSNCALFSLIIAAVVREAILQETHLLPGRLLLKWPNDLYLDQKKCCGILLEQPRPDRLIIGIGLNANNRREHLPETIRDQSMSLTDAISQDVDRTRLLAAILGTVNRLQQEESLLEKLFPGAWRDFHLLDQAFVKIQPHTAASELIEGMCAGVDSDGALLLRTTTGLSRILSGVIHDWSPGQ